MKPSGRSLCRGLRLVSLILVGWAGLQGPVWASLRPNTPETATPEAGTNWIPGYAITLLGVAMGLLVALRSSNRNDPNRGASMVGLSPEELRAASDAAAKTGQKPVQWGPELCPEAKTSLKVAIVGAVIPVAGLGLGPFAIWKALKARKLIRQSAHLTGDPIAVAGLATGVGAAVIGLVWLIALIVMMAR